MTASNAGNHAPSCLGANLRNGQQIPPRPWRRPNSRRRGSPIASETRMGCWPLRRRHSGDPKVETPRRRAAGDRSSRTGPASRPRCLAWPSNVHCVASRRDHDLGHAVYVERRSELVRSSATRCPFVPPPNRAAILVPCGVLCSSAATPSGLSSGSSSRPPGEEGAALWSWSAKPGLVSLGW